VDFFQRVSQAIIGGDMPGVVWSISTVLGVIAFMTFAASFWRKLRRKKLETHDAEDSERVDDSARLKHIETVERLRRIKEILIARARAQSGFLPGGDQPGAKQAEALIEHDIAAAISTLSHAGQIEAAEDAERGDTEAADEALAARIAKIDRAAQLGVEKEEAALMRQRGGLAYTDDPRSALRFYARAAELDPDHIEGLFSLAQLRIRAGYRPALKKSLERPVTLEDSVEEEQQNPRTSLERPVTLEESVEEEQQNPRTSLERPVTLEESVEEKQQNPWAQFLQREFEAALGDRKIASGRHERAQASDNDPSDANNEEWRHDLSVSYERVGDNGAARGDRDGAPKAYLDGLGIDKKLAALDPGNAGSQRDPSASFNKSGDDGAGREEGDEALKTSLERLETAKELAALDPDSAEWQREVCISYNLIGDVHAHRGDSDGALKAYLDGLEVAKKLVAVDPDNARWRHDLSVNWDRVGDARAAQGDREGALKAYADGLEIRMRLAETDPDNAEWQTDLVVSAWKLASAGAEDASEFLAGGLRILTRLDAEGTLTADQREWIGAFEAALQGAKEPAPQG
jgi:tetratricopeptide (TPR) repeat protein